MGTPKVNFNVENQTQQASIPFNGITFVEGITKRGPINDPKTVISSWAQFERIFGGLITTSNFPHLCKRALDGGARLRVNSIKVSPVKAVMDKIYTLTLSAALVTDNVINLKVNGVSLSPAITFGTDSDTTLAALATALETQFTTAIKTADVRTVSGGVDNDRVIYIIPKPGQTVAITDAVVTLGVTQPTLTPATVTGGIFDSTTYTNLFELSPKYDGADYNNLVVDITAATNGNPDYFDLTITHTLESALTETYINLKVTNLAVADQHFLDKIVQNSALVDVTYKDLSSLTGTITPDIRTYNFTTGSDGSAPASSDYIGVSTSRTGFYAFDPYNDAYQICVPEISTTAVHVAGEAYARARKDLVYWAYLSNITADYSTLITEVDAIGADSKWIAYFAGAIKVLHPTNSTVEELSPMGDLMGVAAVSDTTKFPFYSFSGPNRGVLANVLGLTYNYGGMGSITDLDLLANRRINMVIFRDNKYMLWGGFSGSLADSAEQFLNVVRLELYIKKALNPVISNFIEEPTDLVMVRQMYYTVLPFLRSLETNRATYGVPNWQGDQDAATINDLQINNPADFALGKYKVKLSYTPIPGLQEVTIGIVLTPAGVSFEELNA